MPPLYHFEDLLLCPATFRGKSEMRLDEAAHVPELEETDSLLHKLHSKPTARYPAKRHFAGHVAHPQNTYLQGMPFCQNFELLGT